MEVEKEVAISTALLDHCHAYQSRSGLKARGFGIKRDGIGRAYVIVSCENESGEFFLSRALICSAEATPTDESIYYAVMLCTESVLAKQSTIH